MVLVMTTVLSALGAPASAPIASAPTGSAASPDILVADFEGKDYGGWKVEGEAFGPGPARGTLPGQMTVSGYMGHGLVNTFFKGDDSTGTLTSPPLRIQRKYICFLIGGGKYPGEACMDLLVDGKVVRTATGPNDRPGGSENLDWKSWDVSDLAGKTATIRIVDNRKGGWGHINVDNIIQSDTKRQVEPAQREILIERRYLNLPVKTGGTKCRMSFSVDGQVVREFEIELAAGGGEGEPSFWAFSDVSAWQGKRLTVAVDRLPAGSQGLAAITQEDTLRPAEGLYREKLRPQVHFSSRRGWLNDCNGLVYANGEYHMYYQHNPYGWAWGNMHWGHAVSTDLVHWKELPVAIYPHQFGDWVFSGSAVVDKDNTAGFKTGAEDVIVAAYTSTGRGEAIAYSNDRGRTFTDYQGNPVVKHAGRDPKLIWYVPGTHWVMAVYDEKDKSQGVAFHTSPDLKKWEPAGRIDGYFECPEIFEIAVDGDKAKTKWIVYAADGNYAIGTFDGKTFTPDAGGKHRFQYGNAFYASQTWNNIPPADGRRIQIAWGRIDTPGMPFNQCMLFPVELTLRTTDAGPRLFVLPVREIEKLYGKKHAWQDQAIEPGKDVLGGLTGELFDIQAELDPAEAAEVGFNIRGTAITYDAKKRELSCKNCVAPLKPRDGKVRLRVLVDRTSIEIYANDGEVYMPVGAIHPDNNRTLTAFAKGGAAKAASIEIHELRSAYE
jgi:fructan beta-fructosidase